MLGVVVLMESTCFAVEDTSMGMGAGNDDNRQNESSVQSTDSIWTDGVMGYGVANEENRQNEWGTLDGGYEELIERLEKTEQGIVQHMIVNCLDGLNKSVSEGAVDVSNKSSKFIDNTLGIMNRLVEKCHEARAKYPEVLTEPEISQEQPIEQEQPEVMQTGARKVILDTDYASDADDVVALELAMVYDNHEIIDLIGVALSTTYSRSPMAVNNQLAKGGHADVPVAMDTSGKGCQVATQYVDVMYQGGSDKYEQPVQMYRRLLASADSKVSIIVTGFTQNLEDLLNSQPDGYSPLNGVDLIREKVDTVYIVGGNATGRPSFNFYWGDNRDTTKAAKFVNSNLPVRLVYIPEEMGNDVYVGGFYNHLDTRQTNIVTKALKANGQETGVVGWDPFGVYCMVADMQGTLAENDFILHNGTSYISDTGAFEFTDTGDVVTGRYLFEKTRYGGDYNQTINLLLNEKFVY